MAHVDARETSMARLLAGLQEIIMKEPLSIKDTLFFMLGVALMVGALYFTHNHHPPIDIEVVESP